MMASREYEIQTRKNALALLEVDKQRINEELKELTRIGNADGIYGKLPNSLHERRIIEILSSRLSHVTRNYTCSEPIQKNYCVWGFDFEDIGSLNILTGSETCDIASLGYYIGGISSHSVYINKI